MCIYIIYNICICVYIYLNTEPEWILVEVSYYYSYMNSVNNNSKVDLLEQKSTWNRIDQPKWVVIW